MHVRKNRSGIVLGLFAAIVLIALFVVLGLASTLLAAPAATFTVTTTVDAEDAAPGDGACETVAGNGLCTLRAAIQETNALPGADVIVLPAGVYTLTVPGILEDQARFGDLDILGDLAIQGAGPGIAVVDGNHLDRVFQILESSSAVAISGVTVRNGNTDFPSNVGDDLVLAESGGCILNQGALTLSDSIVSSCRAGNQGGGIYSEHTLLLRNSFVRSNWAKEDGGGVFSGMFGFFLPTPTPLAKPVVFETPTPMTPPPPATPPTPVEPIATLVTPTPPASTPVATLPVTTLTPTVAPTMPPAGTSEAIVEGSVIEDNFASRGAGLYNSGDLLLDHSLVRRNQAGDTGTFFFVGGGGIYNASYSLLNLSDSQVISNTTSGFGGGISNPGYATIRGSDIAANHAAGSGGGISNGGEIRLSGSALRSNVADEHGGGIANWMSGSWMTLSANLEGSTISGNFSHGNGGGIYNANPYGYDGRERMELTNSTVSGNLANGSGGGIFTGSGVDGSLSLANVTVASNVADADADEIGDGGGLFNRLGSVQLGNSILAANQDDSLGTQRPDCWTPRRAESRGYNLIGDASTCPMDGVTTGNLLGVDPHLGPLQNNGGSTHTQALLAGSPAIDAADPAGCTGFDDRLLAVDQRGYLRPVDGTGDGEAICDMGAYEYASVPPIRRYLPTMLIH